MLQRSPSIVSEKSHLASERVPLLPLQRNILNTDELAQKDVTQRIVNWHKKYITPVMMPIVSALNGSAIASTVITLSAGWPKKVPKVIAPAIYVGLPFNAIGFLDALAQEYKINRLNKFRHGYRVLINGTNTALFSLQFLIAILDDIYETKNKPFDVSNAAFAGICVGPAILGLITILVQGFHIRRPSDLKNIKNKVKYSLLGLLDLTNNASTAHSFIQDMAALTHPLTSPSGMLLRYSFALAPALAAEGVKIAEHLPENWFSACMLNCSRSFLTYLRASPEQLFLIISALNYAIFNEEVLRNNATDFSVLGTISVYVFWAYIAFLTLEIRLFGGFNPSEDASPNLENNPVTYGINYESDGESSALSMQDDPGLLEDDIEVGRLARQTPDEPLRRTDLTSLWNDELPFALGQGGFNLVPTDAAVLHIQQPNSVIEKSAGCEIDGNSLQPSSSDDLSATSSTALPRVPQQQRPSAKPALNASQQLPVVNQELPLAPNSARHARRHSIHAEMQRSAAVQQSVGLQQVQRARSIEHIVIPK